MKIIGDNLIPFETFYKGSMLEDEIETSKISNYKVVSRCERNYLYIKGKKC